MVALLVVSAEEAAGKTAVCAGIGRYWLGEGRKVGFLKLDGTGGDAAFMRQALGLDEPAASLVAPSGDTGKVKEACNAIARDKDAVIIEGAAGPGAADVAETLDARVIVMAGYGADISGLIASGKVFGDRLLGLVINRVPPSRLESVRDETSAQLSSAGVSLLGVLPEERSLYALTVGELAESVQGKILNAADKSAELVENIMLGAMVVDSGLEYFGRKVNKAAVLRSDRPDMQLAALETSTRCLVLCGSAEPPVYGVMNKAESRGIPVITTENSAEAVVSGLEKALAGARFNQEKKLPGLTEVMRQHFDIQQVSGKLGMAA
ncbi:DRTGG domain-containing protein [Chloroflexota bacterium]